MSLGSGMQFSTPVKWTSVCVSHLVDNLGIVHTLVGAKKWKPDREELNKELKRLGLPKEDFKQSKLEEEILLDPMDPIENVRKLGK